MKHQIRVHHVLDAVPALERLQKETHPDLPIVDFKCRDGIVVEVPQNHASPNMKHLVCPFQQLVNLGIKKQVYRKGRQHDGTCALQLFCVGRREGLNPQTDVVNFICSTST